MDVSVVICTFNRSSSLARTLDALGAQRTPLSLRWELIIVDNNSTDATGDVIERFVREARIDVRRAFLKRQGLSEARNTGLALSEATIVAFTDDDVRPAPDWVSCIFDVMRETGAAIAGGRILPAWEHTPPLWLATRPHLQGPLTIMEDDRFTVVARANQVPTVWGANMAFRREVFDKVGLFDTRRGVKGRKLYRGEDMDLVARALEAGCRVVYDPRLVVWHHIGSHRMRVAYLSRLYFERAEGAAIVDAPRAHALLDTHRSLAGRIWRYVCRRSDNLDTWLECCAAAGTVWGVWKRCVTFRR